ncbi:hypothetical protein Dsin_004066 [Dipteronia sinensis]|uniref:RING-type domain-containing protein n=1 Tax=Dipteronia sinensis TaxID=43782 RepID=A0AAE0BA36_9ROSI|nr:hypothetical protein Dsin_004066 [Dipteronia sinensis]
MAVLNKKITIAHGRDGAAFVSVVHVYRCYCGFLQGAYSNVRGLLPQNLEAKFRELRLYINEVIPTYKFENNVGTFVQDWTVSCASMSNEFPFVPPTRNSTCSTCNSTISSESESDFLMCYLHDPLCEDGFMCSICLREFEHDEDIRILPECKHQFHINCIDEWLFSHSTCPSCRANTPIVHTTPYNANF